MQILKVWESVTQGFFWLRHALQSCNMHPEKFKLILEVPTEAELFEIENLLLNDMKRNYIVNPEAEQRILQGTWAGIPYEVR